MISGVSGRYRQTRADRIWIWSDLVMENQEGKRVLTKEAKPKRKKSGLIAGVVIVAALCAGYAGLCAYAGSGGALLPNTSAAGVDLGGMTADEAVGALETQLNARLDSLTVEFVCNGTRYTVPGSEFSVDAAGTVQAIAGEQKGPFLSRGVQLLAAMGKSPSH